MIRSLSRRFAYLYASIFATPQLASIHYLLLKVALRGLGILNYYDDKVTGERFLVTRFLPRLFVDRHSPIFFDIGANQGAYSLQLANVFPTSSIHAFEPHPRNYRILAGLNLPHFYTHEMALGEIVGIAQLFDHQDRDGSTNASLFQEVISEIHHSTPVVHQVGVDTLDNISSSLCIDHIDFMKLDTEGNELAILRGGQSLLEQRRIDVLQFEFNEMNVVSHCFFYDFRKLLKGYTLFRLLPSGFLPVPETPLLSELFGYQNIVAISQNVVHLM